MKKNMGSADRIIRVVTAAVFVALSLTGIVSGALSIILFLIGMVLVTTSFIGFCPLYTTLGIKTLDPRERDIKHDGVN